MAKEKIEGLISSLHDRLGGSDTSPEQERMLAQMRSQLEEWGGASPADRDLLQTAELLLDDIEEQHPKAAMILRDIIETLHYAGL